jgi:hypothetical protein
VLDCHGRAERLAFLERIARVEPVAVRLADRQVESVRGAVLGRAPACASVGSRHVATMRRLSEHIKNEFAIKMESMAIVRRRG